MSAIGHQHGGRSFPYTVLKLIFIFIGGLLGLFIAQLLVFYTVLERGEELKPADAIVIFSGSNSRLKAGYGLAKTEIAPNLIVSPANENVLKRLRQRYNLPANVINISEAQARTTFENALFTKKLVTHNKINNIILVTSFYHMPRSYLLLRLVLAGQDITVQTFQVKDKQRSGWQQIWAYKKLFHNEMVELWGSLFEAVRYMCLGQVPTEKSRLPKPLLVLKKMLTFEKVRYPN